MKKIYSSIILFFYLLSVHAQESFDQFSMTELDSLTVQLMGEKRYTKGLASAETLLKKASAANDSLFLLKAFFRLGALNQYLNEFDDAIKWYLKAKKTCVDIYSEEHVKSSGILKLLGRTYTQNNQIALAKEAYEKALEIDGQLYELDSPEYAKSLLFLAMFYSNINQPLKAEKLLLQAKEIQLEKLGKEHQDYVYTLYILAGVYQQTGREEEAVAILKTGQELEEKVTGKASELSLESLIKNEDDAALAALLEVPELKKATAIMLEQKMYRRAFYYAQQMVQKTASYKKDSLYADAIAYLGGIYYFLGDYKKAKPLLLETLKILEDHKKTDIELYEHALNNLGMFYKEMDDYSNAIPLLEKTTAITLKKYGEKDPAYANSLENLGSVYLRIGDYDKTLALYQKAEAILQVDTESSAYAGILMSLAGVNLMQGQKELAEQQIRLSLSLYQKTLNTSTIIYADVLQNVAALFITIERYEEAEHLLKEALQIQEETIGRNNANYATSLESLALVYSATNRKEEAKKNYQLAQKINQIVFGKNSHTLAETLLNLANLYLAEEQLDKAEDLYLEINRIYKKIKGHPISYALNLNNLATLYLNKGDYDKALPLYKESTQIFSQVYKTKHPRYAMSLNNLGLFYLNQENKALTLDYIKQAIIANTNDLDSIRTIDIDFVQQLSQLNYFDNDEILKSITQLYLFFWNQEQEAADALELAYALSKAGMQLTERFRNNFITEEDKLRMVSQNTLYINQALEALMKLKDSPQKKSEALSFIEMNKSILLRDALKGQQAQEMGNFPPDLIQEEKALQEKLASLKRSLLSIEDENIKALTESVLNKHLQEINAFKTKIKTAYPKYYNFKYANSNATAADVQTLLDDKTLLLEYYLVDTRIYLFRVSKETVEVFDLDISKKELTVQIKNLRYALSNYAFITKEKEKAYDLYTQTAFWFYSKLLAKALKGSKTYEHLIIVPDAELGHLPFEAFLLKLPPNNQIPYTDLDYLIKDYAISYNYSATLFKEMAAISKKEISNNKLLACSAIYGNKIAHLDSIRTPKIAALRDLLEPIPATKEEVKHLETLFDGDFYYDLDVTEGFFKKKASEYDIIHLAMHGLLNKEQPIFSSLAFSEHGEAFDDNFLHAFEISQLELKSQLVVLSACETGYGKVKKGEGIMSLARSFMYAGVPSLVVSLWQVNDNSTSLIMQYFYQNLFLGMNKAKALQQAKLSYIKAAKGTVGHPAFWSPFIQLGNTTPIALPEKKSMTKWLIGLTLLSVLMGIFFYFRKRNKA